MKNYKKKTGIPFYNEKFCYLYERQKGICPIAVDCGYLYFPDVIHHAGIHNTLVNRKLYPDLINSIVNLKVVNNDFHLKYGNYGLKSRQWAEKWQKFLTKKHHRKINNFVNKVKWEN